MSFDCLTKKGKVGLSVEINTRHEQREHFVDHSIRVMVDAIPFV